MQDVKPTSDRSQAQQGAAGSPVLAALADRVPVEDRRSEVAALDIAAGPRDESVAQGRERRRARRRHPAGSANGAPAATAQPNPKPRSLDAGAIIAATLDVRSAACWRRSSSRATARSTNSLKP